MFIEYATMSVDGEAPSGVTRNGVSIGALSTVDVNWAMGWTYGIFEGSRGQALWFEWRREPKTKLAVGYADGRCRSASISFKWEY